MEKVKITHEGSEGTKTLWEGEFENPLAEALAEQTEEILLHWDSDDSMPLILLKGTGPAEADEDYDFARELSGEECDLIRKNGHVTHILYNHPRASKYDHPICATPIPEIWMGTCGNMGFKPHPELELETHDTGDDSCEVIILSLKISPKVKEALDETTERMEKAVAEFWKIDPLLAGSRLGGACKLLSNQSDEELEASEHPDAEAVLTARRCFQNPHARARQTHTQCDMRPRDTVS